MARSRPVRAFVDAHWPAIDPAKLVLRLLTDDALRARQAAAARVGLEHYRVQRMVAETLALYREFLAC